MHKFWAETIITTYIIFFSSIRLYMHRLWATTITSTEAIEDWSAEATSIQEQIFDTQNWSTDK